MELLELEIDSLAHGGRGVAREEGLVVFVSGALPGDRVRAEVTKSKRRFAEDLHELADLAYFNRTILVASAHNLPVDSYPWRFSSVISVGSHEERDPFTWYANPDPPVELFARGVDVEVAWPGGGRFAAPGTALPRRTSPVSPRSSSQSTRS